MDDQLYCEVCDGLAVSMFYGAGATLDMGTAHTVRVNLDEFEMIYHADTADMILAEICGGEARTSRVAIRRHMAHGPNFDLVVGVDLTIPDTQRRVYNFFLNKKVFVAVMAPPCTVFGPLSNLN